MIERFGASERVRGALVAVLAQRHRADQPHVGGVHVRLRRRLRRPRITA